MDSMQPNQPIRVSDVQKVLRAHWLHNQADAALRQRLDEDPRDARSLLRLGDLHRRMGNFPAAAEAYGRLCVLRPRNRRASWLCAIAAGKRLPVAPPDGLRRPVFEIRQPSEGARWHPMRTHSRRLPPMLQEFGL